MSAREITDYDAIDFFHNGPGLYAVLELSSTKLKKHIQSPILEVFCRREPMEEIVKRLKRLAEDHPDADCARWVAIGIKTAKELEKWK